MQKRKRKPTSPSSRPKSEAQREAHRKEIEAAGGWFLWYKAQREAREHQQETRQTSEGRITADAPQKS